MELVNVPKTLSLVVFELAIVGLGEVLQHTPLALTFEPPILVTFPPDVAVVAVIEVIAVVVNVGVFDIFPSNLTQLVPLYKFIKPSVPQSVQKTIKPVAGLLMAFFCVLFIRGNSKPLFVAVTSNIALAFGELVPMPNCAFDCELIKHIKNTKSINLYFI
jgi:hypothetical protein